MKRRKFLMLTGTTIAIAGVNYYLLSDKRNFVREDARSTETTKIPLLSDERAILYLASIAPSSHNTQP